MIDLDALKSNIFDVVGAIYEVHKTLGPGLNESVYQEGLKIELTQQGIEFEKELAVHPIYKGISIDATYRLDFLVRKDVIIELKAVSQLTDEHRAQLFNYMRLKNVSTGILVNFALQSCQLERYFYDRDRKLILSIYGSPLAHQS